MKILSVRLCFLGLTVSWLGLTLPVAGQPTPNQEEAVDYFRKWLDEDVAYIVTDEERSVFLRLGTDEERERFIEQFWERRNPDPLRRTGNDFKEEHYRRIAFANERYHAGVPGWRTDRGKIYIIHGPPDEVQTYSAGSTYIRSMSEGGGSTRTYPMEVWRYRRIDGLGNDISLEFVDRNLDGSFQLALDPSEKDALLLYPTMGMTLAEEAGLANREDRPAFTPTNRDYPLMNQWGNDSPFQRYALYSRVQAPPENVWRDFERLVQVNVAFNEIPVRIHSDYFRLNRDQVLVPVTVEVENRHITFNEEAGRRVARLRVHGLVRDLTNRIITSFEEDLVAGSAAGDPVQVAGRTSLYQKILTLDPRWRYKLDLLVRDPAANKVGIVSAAIVVPSFPEEELSLSSLVLADLIRPLDELSGHDTAFTLGDLKVRPRKDGVFPWDRTLGVYLQAYNLSFDQSRMAPELEITYRVRGEAGTALEIVDSTGDSVQYVSPNRVVMIRKIGLAELPVGRYALRVHVRDRISQREAAVESPFEVVNPPPTQPVTETAPVPPTSGPGQEAAGRP